MLSTLHIENVAVIENIDITLNKGFLVLTGETGAGKSIIIDSIDMVLGERASKDLIRSGCNSAFVSAVFCNIPKEVTELIKEYGLTTEEDGSLLIQREIFIDGRSICRISGRQITAAVLKEIGRLLVNIHGQHDNQILLHPESHITYLDAFAENENLINRYKDIYSNINDINGKIKRLTIDETEKERRIETLEFQINEIEAAALKLNEFEELSEQRTMLMNSEKISQGSGYAYELLYGRENSINDLITDCVKNIEGIAKYSPELEKIYEKLNSIKYELSDISQELSKFNASVDFSDKALDIIEMRLDLIYRLKSKYGNSIDEILKYCEKSKEELNTIESSDAELIRLNNELSEQKEKLKREAELLTTTRKQAAEKLEKLILSELEFLDMEKVRFSVDIKEASEPLSGGFDIVEFLISTNVGEALKPLAKVASGGELSRIMLSIKNVLASREEIGTLIFDEIDSGISGKAAQKIGLKLRQVAKDKQVICVTHLAQIAALANMHYLISKRSVNGKTFTGVDPLNKAERVKELARIMSGINITETALKTAEEMLEAAI